VLARESDDELRQMAAGTSSTTAAGKRLSSENGDH
jgi:hypothetical protein